LQDEKNKNGASEIKTRSAEVMKLLIPRGAERITVRQLQLSGLIEEATDFTGRMKALTKALVSEIVDNNNILNADFFKTI